ncbi:MAG: hypothetical protein ABIW76_00565 [Fibrobacteria bacterium]
MLFVMLALGAPRAEKVVPAPTALSQYQQYSLTTGGTSLVVGTGIGARITSLKYQGAQMLHIGSGADMIWGSTFWPSPQTYWTAACKSANTAGCFPPPTALDPGAYTGGPVDADTTLTFTGAADSYTHLRFRKTFSADNGDSSFTNRYYMINTSASPITWAPWEDTRFPSGGVSFFPSGAEPMAGNAPMLKQVKDTLGVTWFTWDSSAAISGTPKIFGDGGAKGWMAHVDKSRVLFIKKFQDTPPAKKAPTGENECEIYISRAYLELELQGPYDPIPANDSVAWEVKWYVRKLPDNIAVGRNKPLVDFVNQVVSSATSGLPGGAKTGEAGNGVRLEYRLHTVELELGRERDLSLALVDLRGGEVIHLHSGALAAGRHVFSEVGLLHGTFWLIARERGGRVLQKRLLTKL